MNLKELVEILPDANVTGETEGMEITGITDDSRKAEAGVLFVAIKGLHVDGHDHIPEALKRGASAVITEREVELQQSVGIRVRNSVDALARVAARFYGDPCGRMRLIGITGTNGKTTTSLLIQSIFRESGRPAGLIGTLRYEIGETSYPALNTTPNALVLQSLLHRMAEKGMNACVMEVSSHALALGRVSQCQFDARVFTNLSRDHLDFHHSMEAYYESKHRLFNKEYGKPGGVCVINADDPWGRYLMRQCPQGTLTFGIEKKADFRARESKSTLEGLSFRVDTPQGPLEVRSGLIGVYNIYNILAAVAVASSLGVSGEDMLKGISGLRGVPGRFEKIDGPGFSVVVDYAHTHDALKRLLQNARQLCAGRLITVFGCGGDRDTGKRPLMGRVAAGQSDKVIVTSDNPRTEDPGRIIEEIVAGIGQSPPVPVDVIPDRREAIRVGVSEARAGDIVVVAGKGHEDYQILREERIHFDDREEVRLAIHERDRHQ